MNVKEILINYRKSSLKISIAEATGNLNSEIEQLKENMKVVNIAVERMPEEYQTAIDLHFRQGLSYECIARSMGYTKANIRKRAEKGINLIQEVLENKV